MIHSWHAWYNRLIVLLLLFLNGFLTFVLPRINHQLFIFKIYIFSLLLCHATHGLRVFLLSLKFMDLQSRFILYCSFPSVLSIFWRWDFLLCIIGCGVFLATCCNWGQRKTVAERLAAIVRWDVVLFGNRLRSYSIVIRRSWRNLIVIVRLLRLLCLPYGEGVHLVFHLEVLLLA